MGTEEIDRQIDMGIEKKQIDNKKNVNRKQKRNGSK